MRRLLLSLGLMLVGVVMPTPDNFRFSLPFTQPTTDKQHEANWRALERWANGAPFHEDTIALRGEYTGGSIWTSTTDPVNEVVNGDGAITTTFQKWDSADTTWVLAQGWLTYSGAGVAKFSLHFEGQTVAYDEIHDLMIGEHGMVFIDGIPPGVYTVTMVVTTGISGPGSVTIDSEFNFGGFTLREVIPPKDPPPPTHFTF